MNEKFNDFFYGTIIKLPLIKQIYKFYKQLKINKEIKDYQNEYISDTESKTRKLIFGIKASYDLEDSKPSFYTTNDFEITYLKEEGKYIIEVEVFIRFNEISHEIKHLNRLLDKFTQYMIDNGLSTESAFTLGDVFARGYNINTKFDTIEDCYTMFKLLVNGYFSLN